MSIEDSPMTNLVRGILFDYLGNRLTKKTINEILTRIVKGVLMTREGIGLPPEGIGTNFSDTEVRGDHPEMQPEKPKEVVPNVYDGKKGAKAIVAEPEKEKPKDSEYRVKAIIATPGAGETNPNDPHDIIPVGPVAYKTKK